eukprot:CAMPEP_0181168750 /NCGR_PEP_ID=MMETSP1096-20121128/443_1 /TAXON_ID=156174 ORGANISM="Chrysochromulina ericina, Strain CCMP281" /NCGR_SAMPLE_ID=MMETSP1096 /ASSEMBLY_ACC=CAM_ASM_000453 /LENGTH=42 /DNA_ID= /DNA_START= /DNA_END= /DNA_ORIENTATION=
MDLYDNPWVLAACTASHTAAHVAQVLRLSNAHADPMVRICQL